MIKIKYRVFKEYIIEMEEEHYYQLKKEKPDELFFIDSIMGRITDKNMVKHREKLNIKKEKSK